MTQNTTATTFARIAELEDQLNGLLSRPSVTAAAAQKLPPVATNWSTAVWEAAEALGPVALDADEIARGLEIVHRPLLVCGAHRSGTTLVRDLLDGHPSLSVLPSEGSFFTSSERHLLRLRKEHWLSYMGCEWLRRLANPIHQQPYWLLGRSAQGTSAYIEFARALMAWWPVAREKAPHVVSSWPLLAVALAYAHSTGGFAPSSNLDRWAEKTPTNEQFLGRLRAEFLQAKFVHVVRHPFAVYASHKEYARTAGIRFSNGAQILRDIYISYRAAAAQSRAGAEDYLVIRYEDLLEKMPETVARLAAFAGIEPLGTLMQPTVARLPAMNNSSFAMNDPLGHVHSPPHRNWANTLTPSDCERVTAAVGDAAAPLGYELTPITRWRKRLLRLDTRITSRSS
jgi:Sulfotransferase family